MFNLNRNINPNPKTIGATLYVTMVTCHHHFWKWWWLSPPLFIQKIPIFPNTLGKRIVFFLLPEASCGLKYAENAIAAGAPPRTLLGKLTALPPDHLVGLGADTPPHAPPHSAPLAPRCSRLRHLDHRAPWHQILSMPLVTTNFLGKVAPVPKTTIFHHFGTNNTSSVTRNKHSINGVKF